MLVMSITNYFIIGAEGKVYEKTGNKKEFTFAQK